MDVDALTKHLRTLADPTRLRILNLLHEEELTVTELTEVLNLGQSRVSGHLARMAEEGVVASRREGRFVYYTRPVAGEGGAPIVDSVLRRLAGTPEDSLDREALKRVLAQRDRQMPPEVLGRDYLPGRTWEGFSRALLKLLPRRRMADLGVGGGEITLLLAEAAERIIAVDHDAVRLSDLAYRAKARGLADRVVGRLGDLTDPPIEPGEVEVWILSQVLHLVEDPEAALRTAARLLPSGGQVLVLDLAAHGETWTRDRLGHIHCGFPDETLGGWLEHVGFVDVEVRRVSRDRKPPHFITLLATGRKP